MIEFHHEPVLLEEAIKYLNVRPDGIYVDATLGGAGHCTEIAKRITTGHIYAMDRDEDAIKAASERLGPYIDKLTIIHDNYENIESCVRRYGTDKVDGILVDMGVSSYQIDTPERGFSYIHDAPLDMRMDRRCKLTAEEIVNTYDPQELAKIFSRYGEEKFAKKIAYLIAQERGKNPIKTTLELSELIKRAIPAPARRTGGNPAKRCFQALRIAVNDELGSIERMLSGAVDLLNEGGRLVIITFHSLEDRLVKNYFKEGENPCTCPPDFPVCVCGRKPYLKVLTGKAVTAGKDELERNPRSQSAKLRAAEKI